MKDIIRQMISEIHDASSLAEQGSTLISKIRNIADIQEKMTK
jgi:hypothetical protein